VLSLVPCVGYRYDGSRGSINQSINGSVDDKLGHYQRTTHDDDRRADFSCPYH
jgi:hypothetical protein